MADDTFRPQRAEGATPPPVNITGNVPQEFIQAINQQAEKQHQTPESSLQKPNQNFSSINGLQKKGLKETIKVYFRKISLGNVLCKNW